LQDKGGGGVNDLVSKEDYEELLNRKIEQMRKKNEELLQKHLVSSQVSCLSIYILKLNWM